MMRKGLVIAFDPDVEKSGVAVLDCAKGRFVLLSAMAFPDCIRLLDGYAAMEEQVLVVIEDSDVSRNWHYSPRDTKGVIAAKGRSVGMCHATLRHLHEYAEAVGLDVRMQKPLRKCWRGKDGKVTQEEMAAMIPDWPARSNPEVRDAALLAWAVAGLPLRVRI